MTKTLSIARLLLVETSTTQMTRTPSNCSDCFKSKHIRIHTLDNYCSKLNPSCADSVTQQIMKCIPHYLCSSATRRLAMPQFGHALVILPRPLSPPHAIASWRIASWCAGRAQCNLPPCLVTLVKWWCSQSPKYELHLAIFTCAAVQDSLSPSLRSNN